MTHLEMLVRSHQARTMPPIDWSRRKEKWLHELDILLQDIRSRLIDAGVPAAQIRSVSYTINEESLGQYEATGLAVRIGNSEVVFSPKGSVIIGGYGRVDVSGPHGEVKLIADAVETEEAKPHYDREWKWYVYPDRGRSGSFEFSGDGLANALVLVLGVA